MANYKNDTGILSFKAGGKMIIIRKGETKELPEDDQMVKRLVKQKKLKAVSETKTVKVKKEKPTASESETI